MSGIAGIYYLSGRPVEPESVAGMVCAIQHRGPDGSGVWTQGPVGLGHRLLWTTPESCEERLPLVSRSGDFVLTADARVDNRAELIGALGLRGSVSEVMTDSQLLLHAYEAWGEWCVRRILGDFAFVVWDGRRRVLFCARDPMGVKPFYYHLSDRVFVFGSEIKALLRLPEVPRRLNELRVAEYLVPVMQDKTITFYQDIVRLPPAHTMTVAPAGMRQSQYWSLDPTREIRLRNDAEYDEAFREVFFEAVRCRTRSAFPLGSMLSGGLDSSSIVCVARRMLAEAGTGPLHTFSAIFDEVPECDERQYMQAVIDGGGVEPHFVHGDRISPLTDLDTVLEQEDEPFWAPNLYLHWGMYKAARAEGVRALLDGIDGDTTLWQRGEYLADLLRTGRWLCLMREVSAICRRYHYAPGKLLARRAVRPLLPDLMLKRWSSLRGHKQVEWIDGSLIHPDFAMRIGLEDRLRCLPDYQSQMARTSREDQSSRLNWGLLPAMLEIADRAAAGSHVEPRYPFFDRNVIGFCLALPPEQKLGRGWTRLIMRRAFDKVLPESVRWRDNKSNLSPAFWRGLRGPDKNQIDELVGSLGARCSEYVDPGKLHRAYSAYLSRGKEHGSIPIWWVATLSRWLRKACLT